MGCLINLFNYQKLPETVRVRVTAKAKKDLVREVVDEEGNIYYKVYVRVAAEEGKANKAVIELLAKGFNIPKSNLSIIQGLTFKDKIIKIKQ